MTRPLPTVSPFAERFIEPEEGEYQEPERPAAPFVERLRAMQDAARLRMREHGAWMWRTFFAAMLWGFIALHTHGGWSLFSMIVAIAIGLKWCHHFYEYRCTRIEATLQPDA